MPEAATVHQDEVLTGEAVALDVQPVGFFLNAVGAIIDMLVSIFVGVGLIVLAASLMSNRVISEGVLGIVIITVLVFALVVLPTAVETATRGRSLGRLAVGGRIVRLDGGGTGFRHAFIRALVGVLEIYFTLGALALVVGAFTPRSQRLGDLVAGTYSERTRAVPLPAPGPGLPPGMEPWAAVADVARLPDRLARRIAQFARQAPELAPPVRVHLARELAAEARPYVRPLPQVDPETMLRAVTAVRRERDAASLALADARVATLTAGLTPH